MDKDQPEQHYTQEQIQRLSLWLEYFIVDPSTIKYSGLGMTTLQIPSFYRQNLMKSVNRMSVDDFQYPVDHKQLKNSIVQYFPPAHQFLSNNIKLGQNNMLITSGALQGVNLCIQTFLNPGDEVIVLSPIYSPHLSRIVKKSDIIFKTCRLIYDENSNVFRMDFNHLKKNLTKKTRLLIIVNPCNPASNVWSKQQFETLSKIIEDYPNLMVLEDSAYFLYHNDNNPYVPFGSLSQQNFERSITFYSTGKMLNITGTRLGIVFIPSRFKQIIQINYYRQIPVPSALDYYTMIENLKNAYQQNYYENVRKDIVKIYNHIQQQFNKIGIKLVGWQGTYYAIVNIQNMKDKIDDKWYFRFDDQTKKDSFLDKAVCRMFLKQYGVGLMPLSEWYLDNIPDKFVRLTFNRNQNDIQFLLGSFRDFLQKGSAKKIQQFMI